jgi:hypothetical protein
MGRGVLLSVRSVVALSVLWHFCSDQARLQVCHYVRPGHVGRQGIGGGGDAGRKVLLSVCSVAYLSLLTPLLTRLEWKGGVTQAEVRAAP